MLKCSQNRKVNQSCVNATNVLFKLCHRKTTNYKLKFLDFVGAVVISSVVWKTPKYTPMLQTVKTSSSKQNEK
jgi:hypothetical protein